MASTLNLSLEILKKLCEIFPYYFKDLKEDSYLNNLWESLFESFEKIFQEREEVFYLIEKEGFFSGDKIFTPPPSSLNFHQNLYEERIKILLFKKGIQREEIVKFFKLFQIPFSKISHKDKSLKIFFERENFKNINFYSIQEDFLKENLERYSSFFERTKKMHNDMLELSKEKKEMDLKFEEKSIKLEPLSQSINKSLSFIFEESIMAILSQYEKETNPDHKVLLLQSLRYLYREAISIPDFRKINFLLRNLKLKEEKDLYDLYKEFQSDETFANLIKNLNQLETLKEEEFLFFYENLEPSSQKRLILRIFEENIVKNREEIYNILIYKIREDRDLLKEIFKSIDKNRVQNFIYLLQKLPEDFLSEEELISHSDLSVKAALLRVCKKLPDKKLLEFLDSQNLELKIQTLSYIEKFKKESFVPILISRIKKESFYEKERQEKEKYFEVLAKIKNSEALMFLKELLSEHRLFPSQKREELRAMAALSLAQTKDPKFKEILLRESKSIANSTLVKEACKRASEMLEEKK
ncbi:MAG: HEAT repeat domain-containing protein [Thermoanaerobaculia bacterium]